MPETENVVAELIDVYTSSITSAADATQRGNDHQLPLMERLAYRRQAQQLQELADQALRMINELTTRVAA
jgi:hypothetical protein